MFYVYVLKQKNNRLYYGYTSDLKRRMLEHSNNLVRTTNKQDPELVYYEAYKSEQDARKREIFLKSGQGREIIKKQIEQA